MADDIERKERPIKNDFIDFYIKGGNKAPKFFEKQVTLKWAAKLGKFKVSWPSRNHILTLITLLSQILVL